MNDLAYKRLEMIHASHEDRPLTTGGVCQCEDCLTFRRLLVERAKKRGQISIKREDLDMTG